MVGWGFESGRRDLCLIIILTRCAHHLPCCRAAGHTAKRFNKLNLTKPTHHDLSSTWETLRRPFYHIEIPIVGSAQPKAEGHRSQQRANTTSCTAPPHLVAEPVHDMQLARSTDEKKRAVVQGPVLQRVS
jgi:hypothetical protein